MLVELNDDCERRRKQDRTKFASLIASPAVSAFTLPANGRLFFRSVSGCAEGTAAGTIGPRTIGTPDLAAGGFTNVIWAERGVTVNFESGFEVYLDIGLGRKVLIAGGSSSANARVRITTDGSTRALTTGQQRSLTS